MNIERLNINFNGKTCSGFCGDNSIIGEIEKLVGAKLPESYVKFINQVDGGHPEIDGFYPLGSDPSNSFNLAWFYSVGNPDLETVKEAIIRWKSVLGENLLPIGRDDCDNQLYIDLGLPSPSIWFYLHENGKRLKIAESLEDFLNNLIMNSDFI